VGGSGLPLLFRRRIAPPLTGTVPPADKAYVSVTPGGIGFVVLLGTVLGFLINYNFNLSYVDFYLVIGAVHGIMAMLFSWVASSVYQFFFTTPPGN
jgi:hypothetical protein